MRLLGLLLLATLASAQNGSQFKDWTPPAGDPRVTPKMACSALRGLTGYEFSVATAENVPSADPVPDYCRIYGQILPEIGFQVDLPANWNRRLYMFGNGGYAGEAVDSPQRMSTRTNALRRGFAVTSMNTGHDGASEPLATFATNRQKLLDYAFRSLHVTAITAKKIAGAYYGGPPSRSYFDGCSTGGRQGLILAQ